jgi:hypothetical protein
MSRLYWNTVTEPLRSGLIKLMVEPLLAQFRIVGGTSLSLQVGHRMSIDIDLFTDAPYGSIDFRKIDNYLRQTFAYVSPAKLPENIGMGVSYIVGDNPDESFKLDLFYTTDPFAWPIFEKESIRFATVEEIIAMKIDVIQRGGRKKDFWDLHELLDTYSIEQMIELHKQRYLYMHDEQLIKSNLTDFSSADEDFDPVCLRGKIWEIIKLDIAEAL